MNHISPNNVNYPVKKTQKYFGNILLSNKTCFIESQNFVRRDVFSRCGPVYLSLMLNSPMLTFEGSKVRRFHGVGYEIEIRIIPLIAHPLHFYKAHGQIISVTI